MPMKIHVVAKMIDTEEAQESATTSAHVDDTLAQEAAREHDGGPGHYGVVEAVELDLTRLTAEHLRELVTALPAAQLQHLRDLVIRRQAQLARGRRS